MSRWRTGTAAVAAATVVGLTTPATALFDAADTAGARVASATLTAPSGLAISWACTPGTKPQTYTATLTWNPSTPSRPSLQYLVEVAPTAAGPWSGIATTAATTATDSGAKKNETRHYRVTARLGPWVSAPATRSSDPASGGAPKC